MDYFDVLFAKTNGISSSTCYNEIEAMLKSTVGHSSKNLLDLDKHNAFPSGMVVSEFDADTGSIVAAATGSLRGINYLNTSLGLEPNDGATYIVSFNNNEENTNGRLTIRSRGDNKVRYQVSLNTVGKKELEFTADPELFPSGWYISLLVTGSASETASIDVSGLMLRKSSISDDTFEPYVTPTDEKKQDKPVTLDSTVLTFNIAEIQSKYETLKFVIEYTMDEEFATINYNVVEVPTFIFGRGDTSYRKVFSFSAQYARDNIDAIYFTESGGNVTVNPYTISSQNIIKIIGIPK